MASRALIFSVLVAFLIILPILTQASPFDFVKKLKGCKKGRKVKGTNGLKKYLQHFGYLNYPNATNSHANDDDFDDLLEHALKTYQANYNLNTTGTLDDDTISAMLRPRCGNPDIVNGTNWMQSGKHEHDHDKGPHNSMFHQVEHFSFFPGSPKWPRAKTHLTYGFHSNVPTIARTAIANAFRKWDAATRFSFSQTSFVRADLTIAFGRRAHGDNSPFDGRGGTLAHAYAPTNGRFHYDADELWSIGPLPGRFDVATVALHEIGHLLGLGHSSVQNAIMFPSIAANTVKGLAADDINGIRALYR
ncbi:unnamed protein product [Rhodiola kirilowii]